MKIKTSELTGTALRYAVATADGRFGLTGFDAPHSVYAIGRHCFCRDDDGVQVFYEPDLDWAQGGPIIDRERITLRVSTMPGVDWVAFYDVPGQYHAHVREKGSTALVAAMRCFVASKLGDEIDVPEELL